MTLLVFKHEHPDDDLKGDKELASLLSDVRPQIGDRILDFDHGTEWRVYDRGWYPKNGYVKLWLCPYDVDPEYVRRTLRNNQ